MNLRILKKLSKRAAPLLAALGDQREQFPAERWESYTSTTGHDRKHWTRNASIHSEPMFRSDLHYLPKHGLRYVAMREPVHPLKGTVMVGEMVGYYEREWEEETAWESLLTRVNEHFTAWTRNGPVWHGPRLDTPTRVLKAAREIIAGASERQRRLQSHSARLEEAGIIRADGDGGWEAKCECCGEWKELYCGPEEIDESYEHHCGGSPSCCP